MKNIYIKNNIVKNLTAGHPWCFSGAIFKKDNDINDGELVEIYSEKLFIGIGYYNKNTDISLRIITRKKQLIDKNFFVERFKELKREKEAFINNTNAYRLVFGESDNLPGLVIDLYDRVAVIQIHTIGMEKLKKLIVNALIEAVKPAAIYEKSDIHIRTQEGLEKKVGRMLYGEELKDVEIIENNFKFLINIIEGQKTGFFLDQRLNRRAIIPYCQNKRVLNCFSYTGGFSVYAASTASSVTSVDISKPAIEYAGKNFLLNGFDLNKHKFLAVDVFDYLKNLSYNEYDLIILDPPSFAKNKKHLKNAIKAYITINSKALEKLPDYGILISSSCTTHIDEQTFIKILHQSAVNAGCQLKVLESKLQPSDHSYNLAFPEGRYLKFFILQKYPIV